MCYYITAHFAPERSKCAQADFTHRLQAYRTAMPTSRQCTNVCGFLTEDLRLLDTGSAAALCCPLGPLQALHQWVWVSVSRSQGHTPTQADGAVISCHTGRMMMSLF